MSSNTRTSPPRPSSNGAALSSSRNTPRASPTPFLPAATTSDAPPSSSARGSLGIDGTLMSQRVGGEAGGTRPPFKSPAVANRDHVYSSATRHSPLRTESPYYGSYQSGTAPLSPPHSKARSSNSSSSKKRPPDSDDDDDDSDDNVTDPFAEEFGILGFCEPFTFSWCFSVIGSEYVHTYFWIAKDLSWTQGNVVYNYIINILNTTTMYISYVSYIYMYVYILCIYCIHIHFLFSH